MVRQDPTSPAPPAVREQGELTSSVVNAPMVAPEVLKELQPFVSLAEGLGRTAVQLVEEAGVDITITYTSPRGDLLDTRLLRATVLKGILEQVRGRVRRGKGVEEGQWKWMYVFLAKDIRVFFPNRVRKLTQESAPEADTLTTTPAPLLPPMSPCPSLPLVGPSRNEGHQPTLDHSPPLRRCLTPR